jgi:hypothetical protein
MLIYVVEIIENSPETVSKYLIDSPAIVYSIIKLTKHKEFIVASENDLGTISTYQKYIKDGYYIYIINHQPAVPDCWGFSLISPDAPWNSKINNPHVQQKNEDISPPIEFSRVLTTSSTGIPYRRRKNELKTVLHWGQRKLLIGEIEFLIANVACQDISHTVVYAGASPGYHITFLSKLFPSVTFELYDTSEFLVKATEKIKLHNESFTDNIAKYYTNRNILFISDIRNLEMSDHFEDRKFVENLVRQDMNNQAKWVKIMKPLKAILKFRLPWNTEKTKYLKGEITLPVWGPQTTTETRLIVSGNYEEEIEYDNRLYESEMFCFNTVTRVVCYPHLPEIKIDTVIGEGLDHCYDCTAEIRILNGYITKFGVDKFIQDKLTANHDTRCKCIAIMSKSISVALGKRRLCDKQLPPPFGKKHYDE